MDVWSSLLDGFVTALQPKHLLFCIVGILAGEIVGALPGLGSTTGVALLVPLTFAMDPASAVIMLTGIYYGCMYGGTITSVLLDIPGESATVMTCVDGHKMAMKGRGGQALFIAALGSFLAGTFAILLLTVVAKPLATFGLRFGPPETAMIMLFALTSVAWLSSGKWFYRGLLSGLLGLCLTVVGVDSVSGHPRFTLGLLDLMDGVPELPVFIGMFGIADVLTWLETRQRWHVDFPDLSIRAILPSPLEWARAKWAIFRGTVVGFLVGLVPAGGATTASFLSYMVEKQVSPHREELGHGAIEGVAGPESANNAGAIATYVPMLSLGLPGGPTVAVVMSALLYTGLRPGPLLFQEAPDVVWGLIAAMYVANFMLLALNTLAIPPLVRVLSLPAPVLMGAIGAMCILGAYATDNSMFDVWIAILAGVAGYLMQKANMSVPVFVLALVLGPGLETAMRQAFVLSKGSPLVFVNRPIALVFLVLTVFSLLAPALSLLLRRRRHGA